MRLGIHQEAQVKPGDIIGISSEDSCSEEQALVSFCFAANTAVDVDVGDNYHGIVYDIKIQ